MRRSAYIAGKVTGLPFEDAKQKFRKLEEMLILNGYEVVNPITHVMAISRHRVINGWSDEMRVCIPAMLQCDELHLLPCWRKSKGARLERLIAIWLGMKIIYH